MTASVVLFDRRSPAPDPTWRARLLRARAHSRFVRSLRGGLLIAIAAIGGSVGFFIAASAVNPPPAIDPRAVTAEESMGNPKIYGRDADGMPYVISADSAARSTRDPQVIALNAPRLDFSEELAGASVVEADRGVYDRVTRTLDLLDGVRFSTNDGYSFESEHARVHGEDGRVEGDRMIMGEGPLGSIRAQSFEIRDGGDSVVFAGDVVARLYPDAPAEAVQRVEPAAAEPPSVGDDASAAAQLSRQGGPIDISADSTEFVSSDNVNHWLGHIVVRQGDSQLTADMMDIYFAENPEGHTRKIERIEANGSVVYTTPLELARGDSGVYLASTQRITLSGDISLIRGDSSVTGERLVIDPGAGRSTVTRDEADASNDGRVQGVIGGVATPGPQASDQATDHEN